MKINLVESYLHDLERQLRIRGVYDSDTMAEIKSHLQESVEKALLQGLMLHEAEEQTLRRFGSVQVIASNFEDEKEKVTPMQKGLITIAVISGLLITYVDSRPSWDDTGITAVAILIICGLMALICFQRPWLLALAVGMWIPLYGLLVTHNSGSILALIIAFVGAYTGWAFRSGIRRIFQVA
jgi:hypothetical protein